jgi:succinate dehydrogenase / fumarate reductase, cytochrome b subunit
LRTKRPVFLQLTQIWLPITAISSILHRISGVFLALSLPFLLYVCQKSLESAESFSHIADYLSYFFPKLILWAVLSALVYHVMAGIRHLIMDFGVGETIAGGRFGAKLVMVLSALLIVILGVWIW